MSPLDVFITILPTRFNEHVKAIVFKAGRRVGMLGRARHYITLRSVNAIYISMIRPILEYCLGAWACCGEVNSGTIEALQKRVRCSSKVPPKYLNSVTRFMADPLIVTEN